MHQRITFVATMDVDTEGLNWSLATELVQQRLCVDPEIILTKVIRLEIPEDE